MAILRIISFNDGRYADEEDSDDMEVGFSAVSREERRRYYMIYSIVMKHVSIAVFVSAKLAKKEDEEEERRLLKLTKSRKQR
jgi:hypothetical protein